MSCAHSIDKSSWEAVETDPWGGTETQWVPSSRWTFEELGIGAFRCTQCGEVMFYTGKWKRFYENGEPCSGSSLVPAAELTKIREAIEEWAHQQRAAAFKGPKGLEKGMKP